MTDAEIDASDTLEFARAAAADPRIALEDVVGAVVLAFLEGGQPESALQLLDATEQVLAGTAAGDEGGRILAAARLQTQIWVEIRDGQTGTYRRKP
jgi:hypothetical protein